MIIDQIKAAHLAARKSRNTVISSVIGVVIADLDRRQIYDDQAAIKALKGVIDSNKLALEHATDEELIAKLTQESSACAELLPQAMTDEEMKEIIVDFISESGANSMKAMGGLQQALRGTGKVFDGGVATKIFKELIGL
ncbi:YqeY-like protein [Vibrio phage 1.081.O._10N.286.52.C2]|nr:YqeY-like protein [Vibrio phage 1.081.O._10N.286.52.C2]